MSCYQKLHLTHGEHALSNEENEWMKEWRSELSVHHAVTEPDTG